MIKIFKKVWAFGKTMFKSRQTSEENLQKLIEVLRRNEGGPAMQFDMVHRLMKAGLISAEQARRVLEAL